ncbi:hypothetical protein ACIQBJ_18510 [Kitasatospora sp. NPDC088391]|uniref:hypothetical protein n=1 Tax=Kitasatospora sp. NPDC088391 TaxID=3364074 RepID=UPI00382E6479
MSGTEDMVRGALRAEAARVPVGAWTAGPARAHVRRQRRGRRAAVGAAVAAAALSLVAGTGAVLSGTSAAPVGAASGSSARLPATPPGPAPEAVLLEPGQQYQLGREGWWMRLDRQEICTHDPAAYAKRPDCAGYSWAAGATGITTTYAGDAAHPGQGLYGLIYHGPEKVARMALEVDGTAYWAVPVALSGDPGWTSGWAWAPDRKQVGTEPVPGNVVLAAYDAEGRVLASRTLGQ